MYMYICTCTYWQMFIKVLDCNDNRPKFDQDSYEVSLSESLDAGTNVLTLTATDEDQDKRLFYTLHSTADDGSSGKFQIDSETGDCAYGYMHIFRLDMPIEA